MEENKELEQKKEHGFKSGVLTGVLGTVAVPQRHYRRIRCDSSRGGGHLYRFPDPSYRYREGRCVGAGIL